MKHYYDLDYYYGKDLTYPKAPLKPVLKNHSNIDDVRAHLAYLEDYESAMETYRELLGRYNKEQNKRFNELRDKIRNDYGLSEKQFDLLWDRAWFDGHSEGLRRVIDLFDDYFDFAAEVIAGWSK